MSDLVEFFKQRLDEEEALAKAATPGPWRWDGDYPSTKPCEHLTEWADHGPDLVSTSVTETSGAYSWPKAVLSSYGHDASGISVGDEDGAFIAHQNPARVLAEVAAKRAILDGCEQIAPTLMPMAASVLTQAVRVLAAVYSDHPGYREDWKP